MGTPTWSPNLRVRFHVETADEFRARRVIDFALAGRVLTRDWFCHHCGFIPSGATEEAVRAAIADHWRYVGTLNTLTDPHFEDARLEALLTDQPLDTARFTASLES